LDDLEEDIEDLKERLYVKKARIERLKRSKKQNYRFQIPQTEEEIEILRDKLKEKRELEENMSLEILQAERKYLPEMFIFHPKRLDLTKLNGFETKRDLEEFNDFLPLPSNVGRHPLYTARRNGELVALKGFQSWFLSSHHFCRIFLI